MICLHFQASKWKKYENNPICDIINFLDFFCLPQHEIYILLPGPNRWRWRRDRKLAFSAATSSFPLLKMCEVNIIRKNYIFFFKLSVKLKFHFYILITMIGNMCEAFKAACCIKILIYWNCSNKWIFHTCSSNCSCEIEIYSMHKCVWMHTCA